MEWVNVLGDWVNIGLFGSPVATVQGGGVDASIVDVMASQFVDKINSLGGVLPAHFSIIYPAAATVAFFVSIGKMMWLRSVAPVMEFYKFFVFLMVLVTLSGNWNTVADGWTGWLANLGYQSFGFNPGSLTPGVVLAEGFKILYRIFDTGISAWRIVAGSADDSMAGIIILGALAVFLWATFQLTAAMVITMVFYKLSSLLALCLLPFMLLNVTRFMAAPGITRIAQYGIQFFVLGLIVGLSFRFMGGFEFSARPTADEAIGFAIVVGILATALRHGMAVAKEHIAGSPMSAWREGASTLNEVAGSLNRSMGHLTRAMRNHSREVGHGGGAGGVAAAAGSAVARRFRISPPANDPGAPSGGSTGGSGGRQGGGGAPAGNWAKGPTARQQKAAAFLQGKGVNIDVSGMNRAQASEALEKAGMDETWAKNSSSGQSALRSSVPKWAQSAKGGGTGNGTI